MAMSIFILLFIISAASTEVVHARPSTNGFISIDCGIPQENESYIDSTTGIPYTSDPQYIDTGVNQFVQRMSEDLRHIQGQMKTLRSFPEGPRHCYILPVNSGSKYLVRAFFLYGNYDGQNKASTDQKTEIQFDLYLDTNLWKTVKIEWPWSVYKTEIILVASGDNLRVCLVNIGSGTPFISALELRPLKDTLYPMIDKSHALRVAIRRSAPKLPQVRYPDDPYDRIWDPFDAYPEWGTISAGAEIEHAKDDPFEVPSAVLRFAMVPSSNWSKPEIPISWLNQESTKLLVALHFAELNSSSSRTFSIIYNKQLWWNQPVTPSYLRASSVFNSTPFYSPDWYNFTLVKANNSTLPPILNAMELFIVMPQQNMATITATKKDGVSLHMTLMICSLVVFAILLVFVTCFLRLRRKYKDYNHARKRTEDGSRIDGKRFTYKELDSITNSFREKIGRGGFGTVYRGNLDNSTQVAVKIRSQSSSQGIKELLAEAEFLSRVHHRRLVSFIGYCMEKNCQALVYEYMAEGSLQDLLRAETYVLSWKQRVRISLEVAQGLEYLHSGCRPAIIHRDIKTSNILLNERLEAKISDLGISKAFPNEDLTHLTTTVKGTRGYVDPEYYRTNQLNEKSDVYSFGVVLLELITGQKVIMAQENCDIVEWAMSHVSRGDISKVMDQRLQGEYDVNSAWKIVDIAMRCTLPLSIQRPTMTDAVVQLKEGIELETIYECTTSDFTEGHSTSHAGSGWEFEPKFLTSPSFR